MNPDLVVSSFDSQFVVPKSRSEQPAQVMGHSIITSRDGRHGRDRLRVDGEAWCTHMTVCRSGRAAMTSSYHSYS